MRVEIRAWTLLLLMLAFFAIVCAVAALSAIMQPTKWNERRGGRTDPQR